MEPYRARRKAVFVTFYSFKGGVGRTMSLYFVASILAGRGRRVLMIDFDLAAPGLTALTEVMPCNTPTAPASKMGNGLVELIHDFLRPGKTRHSAILSKDSTRFRHEYVTSLPIPDYVRILEGGYLDLMPCGRMDDTYGHRLAQIDFEEMYREKVGRTLFSRLKQTITQSQLYDYVLIDSRTGFSEESGICTRELADYVVMLMGLNHQNQTGTARFLHKLKDKGWQQGQKDRLLFVISPIPMLQETSLESERLQAAVEMIREAGYEIDIKDLSLQIPYTPRLSLDENPFSFEWSTTPLFRVYEKIQTQLRALVQDDPRSLALGIEEDILQGRYAEALERLRQLRKEDPGGVASTLGGLMSRWPDAGVAESDYRDEFFLLWRDIVGETLPILMRWGRMLLMHGDFQGAESKYQRALEIATAQKDEYNQAVVHCRLAILYSCQGRYAASQQHLDSAFKTFESGESELTNKQHLALAYDCRGNLHYLQGEYAQARTAYSKALTLAQEENYQVNMAAAKSQLAKILVYEGNGEEGLNLLQEAICTVDRLGLSVFVEEAYVDYAECLLALGRTEEAGAYLSQHWEGTQLRASMCARMIAHVLRAKIRQISGDASGAEEDARIALTFFTEQNIHTTWTEQAAAILASMQSTESAC